MLLTGCCAAGCFPQVKPGDPDVRHRSHQRSFPEGSRGQTAGWSLRHLRILHYKGDRMLEVDGFNRNTNVPSTYYALK